MAWHWIIDELKFSLTESAVALAVVRHQSRNGPAKLSQARLAISSKLSVSAVQKALRSLREKGYDVVVTSGKGRHAVNLYRIEQKQGLLFSRANFHEPEPAPVEIKGVRGTPLRPEKAYQVRTVSGSTYGNTKEKPRPPAQPAGGLRPPGSPEELQKRRRIEARDRRERMDFERHREACVGAGPGRGRVGLKLAIRARLGLEAVPEGVTDG